MGIQRLQRVFIRHRICRGTHGGGIKTKEEIRKIFTQYIKIKGNDVESHVNILISHIMVANLKLDPSMILAGSTAKKI